MTAISSSVIGVPRSRMFFRLAAHSSRDSGVRRMCCSSWQILHLFSVRVEPGPETSLSSFWEIPAKGKTRNPRTKTVLLSLNHHSHAVHAVPEIAERVPAARDRLRVAAVVPGAREEGQVAEALRLVLERERAPGEPVAARAEARALPAHAFVDRDLDAVY